MDIGTQSLLDHKEAPTIKQSSLNTFFSTAGCLKRTTKNYQQPGPILHFPQFDPLRYACRLGWCACENDVWLLARLLNIIFNISSVVHHMVWIVTSGSFSLKGSGSQVWIVGLEHMWARSLIQTLYFDSQPYIHTHHHTSNLIACAGIQFPTDHSNDPCLV